MANYLCTIRSNYFKVRDEKGFEEFMNHVSGDNFEFWSKTGENGITRFAFGDYGSIYGYIDEEDDWNDTAYDRFINGLQKFVAEDDAIIILEGGYEKLRYVAGLATVITNAECKFIDISDAAVKAAKELLENPTWATQLDY